MKNILICVTEEPISQKHISWAYEEMLDANQQIIVLYEIVERAYRHPEAPNYAKMLQIEKILIKRYKFQDKNIAPVMLLKYALDNCTNALDY